MRHPTLRSRADDRIIGRTYTGTHWRFEVVSRDSGSKISHLVTAEVNADAVGRRV